MKPLPKSVEIFRPGGQRAIGLDRIDEGRIVSPLPEIVNWRRLLTKLGFDDNETTYLIAWKIDRIPLRSLPGELDWSAQRVNAVRVRVWRKIRKLLTRARNLDPDDFTTSGDSRRLSYPERLPSGRRCTTLTVLRPIFADVMACERAAYYRANETSDGQLPELELPIAA